jgi:hypothetical protein
MFALCEDVLGRELLVRVLAHAGVDPDLWTIRVTGGFGAMKANVPKWVQVARSRDVVFLTDLDARPCPSALITSWFGRARRPARLHVRVAVRTVESWVLADHKGLAEYLSVSKDKIPREPDNESNPKQRLLMIAERSPVRRRREDLVTRTHGQPRQAPNYNSALRAFVGEHWDLRQAMKTSPSLARAVQRLSKSLRSTA